MDSMDLEREKGITILAKNTSVRYGDVKLNIIDTPGHADFGGEVERGLTMVDGVLLLVDASEGPLPQTRFVLRKALEAKLPVILVSTRSTGPTRAIGEVVDEVYELFLDLDADEQQIEFPIVYTNAKAGGLATTPARWRARTSARCWTCCWSASRRRLYDPEHPLQALVTNLDASPYVGRLALCRVRHGTIRKGQQVAWCRADGDDRARQVGRALRDRRARSRRRRGGRAGRDHRRRRDRRGDDRRDARRPRRPAAAAGDHGRRAVAVVTIGINTSPLAGQRRDQADRPPDQGRSMQELVGNVSLRVSETERPDTWEVQGRGELQLAVLVEIMRREGFELTVGQPQVVDARDRRQAHEPVERLSSTCPRSYVGTVTQLLALRKGRMEQMVNHGTGWVRMEYLVPGARADRLPHRVPHRDARHRDHAPRVRPLGAVGGRAADAPERRARRRPPRRQTAQFSLFTCRSAARCSSAPARRSTRA
jgi:small GTP-binding protein